MRTKLAAGNWKMNGTMAALDALEAIAETSVNGPAEVLICPPATLIHAARSRSGTVAIGGQDCHAAASGAHTGDLSAAMLKDVGADYVILGHSERRTDHEETSALVQAKCRTAWAAGLKAIVCIGETLSERDADKTLDIIGDQLASSIPDDATGDKLVVAYEPVWAIGTGKVPTTGQIGEVHDFIRRGLEDRFGTGIGGSVRLLYGGSVKATNAAEIFAVSNVDGALVGGASLKAADFVPIIAALNTSAG
ncbi:triose-phosphate isomerase [Sagittula salina]|uniref:Triosephosphate isomerase n=1 Tax=Sagittula salina TaxID=2820268 RepID=A0A940S2S3_9RHOB|nr:triose-phosphate isomerase [Sagittula salina]MBP0481985.1 triose-phosphate isomerase [Sagittula salina]